MGDEPAQPPLLRVVRGEPTEEELAALVAVLLAGRSTPTPPPTPARNSAGWSARWRGIRTPLTPGPGAWRASGRS